MHSQRIFAYFVCWGKTQIIKLGTLGQPTQIWERICFAKNMIYNLCVLHTWRANYKDITWFINVMFGSLGLGEMSQSAGVNYSNSSRSNLYVIYIYVYIMMCIYVIYIYIGVFARKRITRSMGFHIVVSIDLTNNQRARFVWALFQQPMYNVIIMFIRIVGNQISNC